MPFTFAQAPIPGLQIIQPRVFPDGRGCFFESYKESDFVAAGIKESFVQDNNSQSSKGVLRGLHFQGAPHAQGKLVRVLRGAVWDVAVDIRLGSASFGQWFGLELSEANGTMLWIPLRDDTVFSYKCTNEYNKAAEAGIRWNDADLAIAWPKLGMEYLVSEKDAILPTIKECT
jgi:dTDP-4-dehydrorhamnose 3,5-epimerase